MKGVPHISVKEKGELRGESQYVMSCVRVIWQCWSM